MGAYSPAPVVTAAMHEKIMQQVIAPTVKGMADDGHPYVGFLYAGLMITPAGIPKVVEFNCRFGDPETQPVMMRLQSDLVELCMQTLEGNLDQTTANWDDRAALGVVLAAGGYPESYAKGEPIEGLDTPTDSSAKVFHAGTKLQDNKIVTSGGRVLCVTALGKTVSEAQANAYATIKPIHWKDMTYRDDIGYRAIAREQT